MKKSILPLMIGAVLVSSCATTVNHSYTAKTMDIYGPGVIHKPVVADLDVAPNKITGTATLSAPSSLDLAKEMAVNNALNSVKADVLIEPKYETSSDEKQVTATVSGWPGTYKNFRQIKPEDVPLLQAGQLQKAQVTEPKAATVTATKKKHVGLWVAIGLILAAAVTVVVAGA